MLAQRVTPFLELLPKHFQGRRILFDPREDLECER